MNIDRQYTSRLTNVWELDAIIISYFSLSVIQRLTTNPQPTKDNKYEFTYELEHTLPDPTTRDGLHILADLLGAGTDPIHNHRIFLTIHTLVSNAIGIKFDPWRRSKEADVLWDPSPPPKGDEYATLMDDLSPYAQLIYIPSLRMEEALNDLSQLSRSTMKRQFCPSTKNLDDMARLLGLDLPTPMYQMVVDTIVEYGGVNRIVPTAFGLHRRGTMFPDERAWNPTNNPLVDDRRSYLASLDWIFYEVVSHMLDRKMGYKVLVTQGRGYYRALKVMASNVALMSHLWYSLVEEVATIHGTHNDISQRMYLSDEARASLLTLVLDAWPQIAEVARAGEGTDYNTVVFDEGTMYCHLAEGGYHLTLGAVLDLAIRPISWCPGTVAPSASVANLYDAEEDAKELLSMSDEVRTLLDKYNMVG